MPWKYHVNAQRLSRKNMAHKLIQYVRWNLCYLLVCILMRHQFLKTGHLLSKLLLTWVRVMYLLMYHFITPLMWTTLFISKDYLMVSWMWIWLPKENYIPYFSLLGPSCPFHSIGTGKILQNFEESVEGLVKRLQAKFIHAHSKELNYKVIFFLLYIYILF